MRVKKTIDKKEMLRLRLAGHTYQSIASKAGISRPRVQQLLSPSKEIRRIVLKRDNGHCASCGVYTGKSGQVHHSCLGEENNYNDINNLELLCVSCHVKKHLSMNRAQRSIIQEQAKGTYQRNQYIRWLYAQSGNMAALARQYKISRQAIRKIVMRQNDGR